MRMERDISPQEIAVCNYHDPEAVLRKAKATAIYEFDGLGRKPVTEAFAGNIIAMSGIPDVTIGMGLSSCSLVASRSIRSSSTSSMTS